MSVTVATGQVVFEADTSELSSGLSRGISRAEGTAGSAVARTGTGLGSKLLTGFTLGIGARVGSAVVGAVGSTLGAAISGGFTRAINIQDSEAKLAGLGHSAQEVTGIMDNALASVKGTAFGLGDAGTVAASAVAAGIQPGAQLTGVLKTIADTATIAGASMTDTGAIFNSVAARGKLQGDDLMQLQSRGVPVLAFLAKHYGITAQAASDMVSNGGVDFANFSAAMQENVGGAALKSGMTAQGALANMKAALSRFGATFATPLVAAAPGFFTAVTGAIDSANSAIKPFTDRFGALLGGALSKAGVAVTGFVQGAPAMFGQLSATLGPVISQVGGAISSGFGSFMSTLGPALGPILDNLKPIIPAFANLASAASPLQIVFRALQPILPMIGTALGQIGQALSSGLATIIPVLLPAVTSLSRVLSNGLGQAITALLPIVPVIASLFSAIVPVVAQVLGAVLPLATSLVSMLVPILVQLVSTVLPPVISIFQAIVPAILPLVTTILGVLIPVIKALLPVISTVFSAIVPIISAALQIVKGVIQVVTGIITGNWKQVFTGLGNIVGGAFNLIKSVITGAMSIVKSVIGAGIGVVKAIWTGAWNGMRSTISSAWNFMVGVAAGIEGSIRSKIGAVVSFFTSLPGKITGALGGLAGQLAGVGRNIIAGMVNGIKAKIGDVVGAITGVATGAINQAKSLLGIHSPSRVFAQLGRYVVQGFAAGIVDTKSASDIQKAMTAMANKINDAMATQVVTKTLIKKATAGHAAIYKVTSRPLISSAAGTRAKAAMVQANIALKNFANERVVIAGKLKNAQTALTDALKVRDDYKKSTINSIMSGVDPTQQQNAADFVQSLKDQVTQTRTLSTVMAQLKKSGLDKTTYAELANKGLDALPIAQSILSSGKSGIGQIKTLQGQLGTAANNFATVTGDGMYGAGIQAAQGLVKGLQSQQSSIDKAMTGIGTSLIKSIKKALGIHSPSRVMQEEVGPYLVSGIGVGATRAMPSLSRSLTSSLNSMVDGVTARGVGGNVGLATVGSNSQRAVAAVATAGGATMDNRSYNYTVNEAEDPMGTVGRLAAENRKWARA